MMRTITKTLFYAQIAAMLVTVGLASHPNHGGSPTSQQGVPFHGSFAGGESFEVQFPLLLVDGSGTGNATLLGYFTAAWNREGSLLDGTLVATYHFVAANGDSLFAESIGQADNTISPPDIYVLEVGTITGGTGRFAGSTGSFTLERVVVLTGPDTDTTSGSFDGTIAIARGK
jgi:hypothetical protein